VFCGVSRGILFEDTFMSTAGPCYSIYFTLCLFAWARKYSMKFNKMWLINKLNFTFHSFIACYNFFSNQLTFDQFRRNTDYTDLFVSSRPVSGLAGSEYNINLVILC